MFLEPLKIVFDHTSTKYKVHALPIDTWNLAGEDNFNEPSSLCAPKPRMPYGLGAYRIPHTTYGELTAQAIGERAELDHKVHNHKTQGTTLHAC